jgi:ParB family chromosome partitioning protein
MARKNLLMGLSGPELPAGNSSPNLSGEGYKAPHLGIMGTRGAIGAVTRSIEQLKAQSVLELSPDQIEPSFISDRLETSPESHHSLVESIREHGQQVPVLVRPHPDRDGCYQIAYGRRRLRAVAELGLRVRAIVRPLTDQQLVIAQGQENSARTDLSFIEKALFAARLEESGYTRETIMAALSVDKTGLSRLISSAVKIPRDVLEAIGAAPKVGRDRWIELAERLENAAALDKARELIGAVEFGQKPSDERFELALSVSSLKRVKAPRLKFWKAEDGTRVVQIKDDPRRVTLAIDKKAAGAFGSYLIEQLPEIYAAFKRHGDK